MVPTRVSLPCGNGAHRPDVAREHSGAQILAATSSEAATAFVEVGAIAIGLSFLALIASRVGITAVPLYLMAGLAFSDGRFVST